MATLPRTSHECACPVSLAHFPNNTTRSSMLLARCAASTAAARAVAASSSSSSSSLTSSRHTDVVVGAAEGSGFRSPFPIMDNNNRRHSWGRRHPRSSSAIGSSSARAVTMTTRAMSSSSSDEDEPEQQSINDMMKEDLGVDVEDIKSMIEADPVVREQERLMATEARNAASLQVDAQMAEEESKIAKEYGSKESDAGAALKVREIHRDARRGSGVPARARGGVVGGWKGGIASVVDFVLFFPSNKQYP